MTLETLAAVALVAAALLAGLRMTLAYLREAHLTKTQVSELRQWIMERLDSQRERLEKLADEVGNEKQRLTQLANRVR